MASCDIENDIIELAVLKKPHMGLEIVSRALVHFEHKL